MQGRHQTGCTSTTCCVADRPCGGVVGRPEHRRHADAGGGGQMHRARIVGHEPARAPDDAGERRQVGPADEIDDRVAPRERVEDLSSGRGVGRAADHRAAHAVHRQRVRELGEIRRWPALGAAVRRARRQRHQRCAPVPPAVRQQPRRPVARVVRHGDARLDRTIRKSQRVHQLLVVLHLVQSPCPARRRASADRRASPRGSPSVRGCRRARRPAPNGGSSGTAAPCRNPGRQARRRAIATRPRHRSRRRGSTR